MTSPTASTTSTGALRLSGLQSGIDTDAIIQALLATDKAEIDTVKQNKEVEKAKIDTWNDIAEQLKSLATATKQLRSDGTDDNTLFSNKDVSVADTTKVSATASPSAVTGSYSINVTQLAQSHTVYSAQKASNWTAATGGNFTLNGAVITLTAGDSLATVATNINAATYTTDNQVTAYVIDNRLVIAANDTGADSTITFTDTAGKMDSELELVTAAAWDNTAQTAQDANVTLFGTLAITGLDSNSVSDLIPGVSVNFLSTGTTRITVTHDTAAIKNAISDWVDSYNEMQDLLARVKDVKLSDTDTFGIFHSDSMLRSLQVDLRSTIFSGTKMGTDAWAGTVLANGAVAATGTSIAIDGLSNNGKVIKKGDMFTISGQSQVYTVTANVTVAGAAATLTIDPPLVSNMADNTAISVHTLSLNTFGIGSRSDDYDAVQGVLGIIDEGELDEALTNDREKLNNIATLERLFSRIDDDDNETGEGIARKLFNLIDTYTQVSVTVLSQRSIDDVKINSLNSSIQNFDERIELLESRYATKEQQLIRKYSEMESAIARAQSAGNSLSSLTQSKG